MSMTPQAIVDGMMTRDAFSRWLGVEVLETAPGQAAVRMIVRDEMVNGFGVAHGGIAFALADSALAFAANTHGQVAVSVENSIRYPEPVRPGDVLTARAQERTVSGPLGVYDVAVTRADGTEVASLRGTVYRTKRRHGGRGA